MAEDNCALNCDRTLKDASEIQWHYDPDDEMPLPKNNKRKKFLDIKVKVASDSEGEEDDEDMDGFINNEDQDEEDPNTSIVRLTLQRSFYVEETLRVYKLNNALIITANLSVKFLQCAVSQASETSSSSAVSKHNIPRCGHNTKDWPLWSVAVKDGSEEDVVFSLSLHGGSKYIHSAFSLSVIPGHVYVEAKCLDDIKTSTRILADVYQNSICAAPATTWDVSFSKIGEHYIPSKNTWVQLRGSSSNLKPPCELFNPEKAQETSPNTFEVIFEDQNNRIIKGYKFRKSFYTPDGFILHEQLKSGCHYQAEATPTIDELWSFESCSLIPKKNLEDTRRAVLSATIRIGDQVKVVLQQPKVLLAFIEDISEGNATLRLLESPTILFEYLVIQLQKCFKIGDGIRVKSGHLKGIVGMVSDVQPYGQIGEEKVTIITFPIKIIINIFAVTRYSNHLNRGIMTKSIEAIPLKRRVWRIVNMRPGSLVKFGTRKGDMGILKSVNADGKAILEVQAHLISSNHQDEVSIKDLYIPRHYDTFPEIFKGLNIVGDSSLSMNICPMPQWENDLGTGSHTPAWNPSSRTLQISNAAAAEFIVYPHRIPENEESTGHLEPSGPLPPSMQTFVIDHWIKRLVDSDSLFLSKNYLDVIISGSQPTMASSGFENGRVPPERRGQLVTVVNHLNHQIYRGEYQVVDLKGEAVFAYPHKGKKRLDRGINIPMGDLAVIAKRH
ncbi:hypothetical protein BDQ17DRAFT_1331425 [Cyathus striatus]|nr:hypothetical protein BDQ17DRAFT_1331425 [Cyathus striatus]